MHWELRWEEDEGRGGIPLGSKPVYLGRAPTNDVVLDDPAVSGRHAAVWTDGTKVFVEDLRSRNGTFVNGKPVKGTATLRSGDQLRLGGETVLRASRQRGDRRKVITGLVLVDEGGGVALPIRKDRIRIGASPDADLRIMGAGDVVLLVQGTEVWRGQDDDLVRIALDEPFVVGDRTLVVRATTDTVAPTRDLQQTPYPYVLEASLVGERAHALLIDRDTGVRHEVTAPTRAALLWILAQKIVADVASDLPPSEVGWADGREVRIGVWGRGAADSEERLNVLVHRVRKELREAGFDPYFLERRSHEIRARVAEARVV